MVVLVQQKHAVVKVGCNAHPDYVRYEQETCWFGYDVEGNHVGQYGYPKQADQYEPAQYGVQSKEYQRP